MLFQPYTIRVNKMFLSQRHQRTALDPVIATFALAQITCCIDRNDFFLVIEYPSCCRRQIVVVLAISRIGRLGDVGQRYPAAERRHIDEIPFDPGDGARHRFHFVPYVQDRILHPVLTGRLAWRRLATEALIDFGGDVRELRAEVWTWAVGRREKVMTSEVAARVARIDQLLDPVASTDVGAQVNQLSQALSETCHPGAPLSSATSIVTARRSLSYEDDVQARIDSSTYWPTRPSDPMP